MSTATATAPVKKFVNGVEYAKGHKVVFGRNWARTGKVQGFGLQGGYTSVLIEDDKGQLEWRTVVKPAADAEVVSTTTYVVLAKDQYRFAAETEGLDTESEDYARLVKAGWLEKFRWTRTAYADGDSNLSALDYSHAQV